MLDGAAASARSPLLLRDLPIRARSRSIVFCYARSRSAPLHPIFGPLRSVFRSAHMLCPRLEIRTTAALRFGLCIQNAIRSCWAEI